MIDYKEALQKDYDETRDYDSIETPPTKVVWLSTWIFNFDTYDEKVAQLFGSQMIDTIESLLNRTTYEYIKNSEITFITMVNMPFLKGKLEWGVSIRGAWIDEYYEEFSPSYNIVVPKGEIRKFLTDLISWSKN